MKKTYTKSALCIASLILCINLHAQNCWSPLGSGTNGYVSVMTTYNGNLIVAGNFDSIGGIAAKNIAVWNGTSWSAMGSGISIDTSHSSVFYISSLMIYNGELYAAGEFDTAGGVPVSNIAKWNGALWAAISGANNKIFALTEYNGALYAGGAFDTIGGIFARHIARWDGTQWSTVDSGIWGQYVWCLTVNNGLLYAGGVFTNAGGTQVNNIALWNDISWSSLGSGIGSAIYYNGVCSMSFYQGILFTRLYHQTLATQIDSIYEWDGTMWSWNSNISRTGLPNPSCFFTFDGKLVIAGGFDNIGGVAANNLAQWDGNTWSEFGGGLYGGPYPQGNILCTYNGYLYAGGYFTKAGNDSVNNIAEYTCATDGIHMVTTANHVHLYPNPSTGMVNVTIDELQPGYSVGIYDMLGQRITQTAAIKATTTEINLRGQAPGTYHYRISGSGGENVSTGMFVIQ